MTLATHAIVGGSIAALVPGNPLVGFILGFGSHFILDSIPHFDYKILSISEDKNNKLNTDMRFGKKFLLDLARISFDASLGFFIIMSTFYLKGNGDYLIAVTAGALGGILPDPLQFAYFKLRLEPLISLQKFHLWMHAKSKITDPIKGIAYQILVAGFFYLTAYYFLLK